jgi:hypothetical protein
VARPRIEVVFVLGGKPAVTAKIRMDPDEYIETNLKMIGGRIVYYDQLITNALAQYDEYLAASTRAKRLDELLGSLDSGDGAQPEGSAAN